MPKQGVGVGKGRWQEIRYSGLCPVRAETSYSSGCRLVARSNSYHLQTANTHLINEALKGNTNPVHEQNQLKGRGHKEMMMENNVLDPYMKRGQ
jgi:hypothetical protein